MSEAGPSFFRCNHCRGFYESDLECCKWCEYRDPVRDEAAPKLFPDRAACRTVQVAEYHALPPEAHADCMKPPADHLDLVCECIHCGARGHRFEAVEMRWMANEQMWACPCTTCGGRGFTFDVHPCDLGWHCSECDHYFAPPDGKYYGKNAVCPKCGSKHIDGWFDDDPDEEYDNDFDNDDDDTVGTGVDEALPWEDDDEDDDDPDDPYGLTKDMPWKESDSGELPGESFDDDEDESGKSFGPSEPYDPRMPDDIDFPRPKREKGKHGDDEFNDDDIPF